MAAPLHKDPVHVRRRRRAGDDERATPRSDPTARGPGARAADLEARLRSAAGSAGARRVSRVARGTKRDPERPAPQSGIRGRRRQLDRGRGAVSGEARSTTPRPPPLDGGGEPAAREVEVGHRAGGTRRRRQGALSEDVAVPSTLGQGRRRTNASRRADRARDDRGANDSMAKGCLRAAVSRARQSASSSTRRRRSEFDTTVTDDSAIAPAAIIGISRPAAAIGIARTL